MLSSRLWGWPQVLLLLVGAPLLVAAGGEEAQTLKVREVERIGTESLILEASGKLRGEEEGPAVAMAALPPELREEGWLLIRRESVEVDEGSIVIWEDLDSDRHEVTVHVPTTRKGKPGKSSVTVRLVAAKVSEPPPALGPITFPPRNAAVDVYGQGDFVPFRWSGEGASFRIEVAESGSTTPIHKQQVMQHGIELPVALFPPDKVIELRVSQADQSLRFGPIASFAFQLRPHTEERLARCRTCGGHGVTRTTRRCRTCGGRGVLIYGGQTRETCGSCGGTGTQEDTTMCMTCRGRGEVDQEVTEYTLEPIDPQNSQ